MDMWNFARYLGFAILLLLLVEARAHLMLCAGYPISVAPESTKMVGASLIDRPAAVYDEKTGYRWQPGATRIIRTFNGEVIFDNEFRANAQGYISHRDYTAKKKAGVRRVAILGDSFTAATYLKATWPESAERAMAAQGKSVEFYSFAMDGAGVTNWNRIFFDEILPKYEFDELVIASGRGHLDKGFFFLKSLSRGIWAGTEDQKAELDGERVPVMFKILDVVPAGEIDKLHARPRRWHWTAPEWRVTRHLVKEVLPSLGERAWRKVAGVKATPPMTTRAPAADGSLRGEWAERYGKTYAQSFFSILDECRRRGLPVVLTAVPGRDEFLNWRRYGAKPEDAQYLQRIAEREQIGFFDAYAAFPSGDETATVKKYWLKYDAHWNDEGAALFGRAFATYLSTEKK